MLKQFPSVLMPESDPYFLKDNLVKLWKVSGFLPKETLEDIRVILN